MDNPTREYSVLIYPGTGTDDTPSAAVYMDITGSFETFYKQAMSWIKAFERPDNGSEPKSLRDGEHEDILVSCKEEEIILSLLYCCENPGITVRKISYQGNSYTDISDMCFLKGASDRKRGDSTYSVRLNAKKNGQKMQIHIFGPYIHDFNRETVRVGEYPLSSGMVEMREKQIYAGTYSYTRYGFGPEKVHVFLERDQGNVIFRALLDGRLYKKISRDEEKIVFYSAMRDETKLVDRNRFWMSLEKADVVFNKIAGGDGYGYADDPYVAVIPPQMPDADSLDSDSVRKLCLEYINCLYMGDLQKKLSSQTDDHRQTDYRQMVGGVFSEKSDSGVSSEKTGTAALIAMRKELREHLKEKVKGQDMAVDKFVEGYIRYRLRGKVSGKPAGLYLFAGPPGTGKTYLAESFAELLAGQGYKYKRFDMASYSGHKGKVDELVGSAKVWVGAQPGRLTGFVRENPKCVLLFDEIEKAIPEIRLLFLSVMEGAVLTDQHYNKPVSFEDAILIFTTNEGKDLYEDNRGTNLTALPDSAVLDGLASSGFAPEMLSRFMSGTIVVFNHLSYHNLYHIFKASLDEAVSQLAKGRFAFHYGEELPKFYLLSKGDHIDARFVSTNTKRMAEDYYLEALDYMLDKYPESLDEIGEISVAAEVTDEIRGFFEMTQKPRILGYVEGDTAVYAGEVAKLRGDLFLEEDLWELRQAVEFVPAKDETEFGELFRACNWNSPDRRERYDAVLIDLGGSAEDGQVSYDEAEGYACLKTAAEEKRNIPIIVVDRGDSRRKASLMAHGATDFVEGTTCRVQRRESLAIDWDTLKEVLDKRHVAEMAAALSQRNLRISGDVTYDYEEKSKKLSIRFTRLRVTAATEENAEARRQNRKYLLVDKPQVRLEDVYGNEQVKKAARRCIDNIKNPEKYREAGARLMKGILMYGAPGMGKTMVAKALSYESGASFISRAGSDFLKTDGIERLEEVFRTARRNRPCILFIDEFDAISQSRGGQITNDQEIVLEKFLKEMDGLETDNEGVYVVGATNYDLESLDGAVTRRFSAKIPFPFPDKEERLGYLRHLLKEKGLDGNISERAIRTLNLMMSGKLRNFGEIRTFIEESIAEAVFEGRLVTKQFLYNRILDEKDGAARQNQEISQTERGLTAYHEAGHAVLRHLFKWENEYVTIVSRGDYGGDTMSQQRYRTGQNFLEYICICFAGRAAEKIAMELTPGMGSCESLNTGAAGDLQNATQAAYDYVCRYAMDGRFMVVPQVFKPQGGGSPEDVLPEAEKEAIWTSVKQILEERWEYAGKQLRECWGAVQALAVSLMYMQALDDETVEEIIRKRIPYVEEGCFLDYDCDYKEVTKDGAGGKVPFGYPVYPRSEIKRQQDEEDMTGADDRHYFYAVKKGIEKLGLYEELQEAFEKAYLGNASCRRFESREAAQEYLEMLEIKAFRRGEERSWGISVDGLTEMIDSSATEKRVLILKGEEVERRREDADEAGMPLAQYIIESIEAQLDRKDDFYIVVQIYDEEFRAEMLGYLCARGFDEVISKI